MAIQKRTNNDRKDFSPSFACTYKLHVRTSARTADAKYVPDSMSIYKLETKRHSYEIPARIMRNNGLTSHICVDRYGNTSQLNQQRPPGTHTHIHNDKRQRMLWSNTILVSASAPRCIRCGDKSKSSKNWAQVHVICFPCHFSIYLIPVGSFRQFGHHIILLRIYEICTRDFRSARVLFFSSASAVSTGRTADSDYYPGSFFLFSTQGRVLRIAFSQIFPSIFNCMATTTKFNLTFIEATENNNWNHKNRTHTDFAYIYDIWKL